MILPTAIWTLNLFLQILDLYLTLKGLGVGLKEGWYLRPVIEKYGTKGAVIAKLLSGMICLLILVLNLYYENLYLFYINYIAGPVVAILYICICYRNLSLIREAERSSFHKTI